MNEVSIVVPAHNRPRELRRLLEFLHLVHNPYPVYILDGSRSEIQNENASVAEKFAFAKYHAFASGSHMGIRCAEGLRLVSTPYTVVCADDDFVFPDALSRCVKFLADHPDYSAVMGQVYSLRYFKKKFFFKNGFLLDDPLGFIGYMAHERFLQRALYYFAYTYLGSVPLFYGLKRTGPAREAFSRVTERMKYSGVEVLSNTIALIRGKVAILETPFGLRDYSCPTFNEPTREDPKTYFAQEDIDYMRPIFSAALAEREHLPLERADEQIDLFLTHWAPPDWRSTRAAPTNSPAMEKIRLATGLMRSMYWPEALARKFGLSADTVRALRIAHQHFVSES